MNNENKHAAQIIHEQLIDEYTKIRVKNISQEKLAVQSGAGQNLISKIENNKNAPKVLTFLKLLLPLGKTLSITPLSDEKNN